MTSTEPAGPSSRLRRRLSAIVHPDAAPTDGDRISERIAGRIAALADRSIANRLALAEQQLAAARPRVAVIGDPGDDTDAVLAALAEVAPHAQVELLAPVPAEDLHVWLAAKGPHDVILDEGTDPQVDRAERARAVLGQLRSGGVLVVGKARHRPPAEPPAAGDRPDFGALLAEAMVESLRRVGKTRKRVVEDAQQWGRAVGAVAHRGAHLAIVNGLPARAKIREEQVGRYLDLVGPTAGRILLERPARTWDNPLPVRHNEDVDAPVIGRHFEAPPMQLREYADVVCWPGQVVTQQNVLLPETFRHLRRTRLTSRWVEEAGPLHGRVRHKGGGQTPLEGTYFHLDSEYRGHFGHAMTEQISRLWAWQEAKRREPELKALLLTNRHRTTIEEWEYRLFEAAGVAREDLVLADGPVRVTRLLAATPMFSQPDYVHPELVELYRRIGDDLAADAPERDYPARIFCSRRLAKRACNNTSEVEEFFAARGFEIVFPEEHPLGEQVQMFRSAEHVAGFAGSAMFTAAFVPVPTRLTLVSSTGYWAQNEFLIAAVLGHQADVAWSRPDLTREAGYHGRDLLQSTWTFDPDREGRFLDELLRG